MFVLFYASVLGYCSGTFQQMVMRLNLISCLSSFVTSMRSDCFKLYYNKPVLKCVGGWIHQENTEGWQKNQWEKMGANPCHLGTKCFDLVGSNWSFF